ncbi:hypothetical protein N8K70_02900 [Microbacterium betulae]|uniref:Uncharacterized protein n=1 Tax=Microbacterium betulae TaxID=2981139 RepID=A0AA97FJ52_9MICO|nr:hypothetical protein [Microbacterium sp. AB]WOF23644.1 hypothetical protein N8K70_02900 [Microbacterium sp. AB]
MSAPYAPYDPQQPPQPEDRPMSKLIKGSIWIAIGALIAAALVCVVWVLVGDQNGLIGKAFLTVLLLAAFAGVVLLDAGLAPRRPDWFALASMVSWIVVLLVGAVKIWIKDPPYGRDAMGYGYGYGVDGAERFFQFVLVIGVLQLTLLHARLYWKAHERHVTTFTRTIAIVTTAFLLALAGMLVFFLTFPRTVEYGELYWRIVVSLAILAAVGTTILPLLNALFAPKRPRSAYAGAPGASVPQVAPSYGVADSWAPVGAAPQPQAWPTYVDGVTPLPVLPDGSPDWNAYYTGYPTYPQWSQAPSWQDPSAAPDPSGQQWSAPAQTSSGQPAPDPSSGPGGQDIPPRPPLPPVV